MSNALAKLLLFILCGGYIWWNWVTINRPGQSPESREAGLGAFSAAVILQLILLANALAFSQMLYIEWVMDSQRELWNSDGNLIGYAASRWDLIFDQFNFLSAIGYIFWLIRDALSSITCSPDGSPEALGKDIYAGRLKQLLVNHWPGLIGLGVFFIFTSGGAMFLFLFLELAITLFALWVMTSLNKEDASE